MHALPRSIVLVVALMAIATACGGATPAPATPAPVTPAPATPSGVAPASTAPSTVPSAASVSSVAPSPSAAATPAPTTYKITTPATTVTAKLTKTYDTSKAAFDPVKLNNLAAGVVTAQWFRGMSGTWIVFYSGLATGYGDLCLGNSINNGSAFDHISNSARGAGACAGDDKYLVAAPKGVYYCNTVFVFYVTDVPNAATGTLYASVEKAQPDGSIVGITSTVAASQTAPKLDLGTLGCAQSGY